MDESRGPIILIDPQFGQIAYVARDIPYLRGRLLAAHPPLLVLTGHPARLLFEAVTGRGFDEPPDRSSSHTALSARIRLAAEAGKEEAFDGPYELAMLVLEAELGPGGGGGRRRRLDVGDLRPYLGLAVAEGRLAEAE